MCVLYAGDDRRQLDYVRSSRDKRHTLAPLSSPLVSFSTFRCQRHEHKNASAILSPQQRKRR